MTQSLNWVDYIMIGLFFISILVGLMRGFIRELIAVLIWVAALLIATFFASPLAEKIIAAWHIHEKIAGAAFSMGIDPVKSISLMAICISFISIFIVVIIVGSVINYFMSSAIELSGISIGNRLLGALFGFLRGFLIILVLIFFVELSPVATQPAWKASQFVHAFQGMVIPIILWIKPNTMHFMTTNLLNFSHY